MMKAELTQKREFEEQAFALVQASIQVKQKLLQDTDLIAGMAEVSILLVRALKQGKKLLLCGNGGSAADAQHIAAEFVGRFAFDRPALPALALSVNTSCLTAIGNDYSFDLVFARQVEALGKKGDVFIGISTSGNSANVLQAALTARRLGMHTVGLTGSTGGKLKGHSDFCLCAPSEETPRIQESHILMGHIISQLVEHTLFATK
jgi:D-sedoheptulose 7-phosphate isomerase